MTPPKHAFEVVIRIGGESREYVARAAKEAAEHLQDGCIEIISGGGGGSFNITVEKREITPDAYRVELEEYIASLRQHEAL